MQGIRGMYMYMYIRVGMYMYVIGWVCIIHICYSGCVHVHIC